MSDTKMTLQAAVAYLQPIADSAIVGGYAEALDTVMRAAQVVPQPNREALEAVEVPLPNGYQFVRLGKAGADAVLAALSAQTVEPASEDIPERDATPDGAFELGKIAGYDEAMREVAAQAVEGEVEAEAPAFAETITIPAPHVPFGPEGVPGNVADADYLRHAIKNIKHLERGERLWGSNLTATIVKLLGDAADALAVTPTENGEKP